MGYVAGQPFPLIDPNDPHVAVKIMWNNVFRPITTDDYDLRFFDCESAYETKGKPLGRMIEYFQVGHYTGYDLVGRTEVEPLPIDPDFKKTDRLWLFALYPLLAPQEIRGEGFIRYRYAKSDRADGGTSACPEAWEMRHLYVIEATPWHKQSTQALHGKTLIYMDSEVWFEPYIDTYDQQGRMFQNHIYWLTYRDRPVPDARVAIYPFKREFVVGAVSTDEQSGLATMCYAPGANTPEHECWYINMGAVGRDFFTVEAMSRVAP